MIVIKIIGFASGNRCPHAGLFVETFDFEAYDGAGFGTFTSNPQLAMQFADHEAAFAFWKTMPKCKRVRDDGRPNRPMTASTVLVMSLETET